MAAILTFIIIIIYHLVVLLNLINFNICVLKLLEFPSQHAN